MSMGMEKSNATHNTKADSVKGSLDFTHNPRWYFNFKSNDTLTNRGRYRPRYDSFCLYSSGKERRVLGQAEDGEHHLGLR